MKAKLYILGAAFEIKLSNDEVVTPDLGESKEDFIARTKEFVNNELLDEVFELIEIDKEMVATNSDETLVLALKTAEGIQKQLIESVIADRKVGKKEPKEKKEKIEAVSAEEAKESAHYKESEANIGKFVQFSPFKSTEVLKGKIVGLALNKTNTIVYYTVVEADGKRRCCGAKNETVKFIEPIKDFKEEKAAKAKPATAKKEVAEKKPAKGKAKAAAPKAEEFGDQPGGDLL